MEFDEIDHLLSPKPLKLETGIERLIGGGLHVASQALLPNIRGEMINWWLCSGFGSELYRLWHPADHVFSAWEYVTPGKLTGATHTIRQKSIEGEVKDASLTFIDPAEVFTPGILEAAWTNKEISFVNASRGIFHTPGDSAGAGVARDTPFGCIIRNHYFFGLGLDMDIEEAERTIPDEMGLRMLAHDQNENFFLSQFLRWLYITDNWENEKLHDPFEN